MLLVQDEKDRLQHGGSAHRRAPTMSNGFAGVCNMDGRWQTRSVSGGSEPCLTFCLRMIFSENRFPSPIGVEDMLFGIMRYVRGPRLRLRRDCRESMAASSARRGTMRIRKVTSLLVRPGMTTRCPRIRPR